MSKWKRSMAFACAAVTVLAAGCSGDNCEDDSMRPCYTGPVGTSGIGLCRDGVQRCIDGSWEKQCVAEVVPEEERCDQVDNDCDGIIDEDVRNACGGCAKLPGAPGEPGPNCSTWACDGEDALVSVPPETQPGSECEVGDCVGIWTCGDDRVVECSTPRLNACGICGGTAVEDIGETCETDGCEGTWVCSPSGLGRLCNAPKANNCGACGAPDVAGIDGACVAPNGCRGVLRCSEDGRGSFCEAPERNNCGACGGEDVTGLGEECGAVNTACAGVMACNELGTGNVCAFEGFGTDCEGANGCVGTMQCDEAAGSPACAAPVRNACDVCGGPEVTGIGDACTTAGGCEGTLGCNSAGTEAVCVPSDECLPATNHVVISEVAGYGPGGGDDEFVELYNPTLADVSVGGWSIWRRTPDTSRTSTSGYFEIAQLPAGTKIRARGYLLVGDKKCCGSVMPDIDFVNVGDLQNASNQVFLVNTPKSPGSTSSEAIVDMLGYGTSKTFEGSGAAPAQSTSAQSIERKAHEGSTASSMSTTGVDALLGNGQDTDDNKKDFVLRANRDPQNSHSPVEPPAP